MGKTIKGGLTVTPKGVPVDANGKPVTAERIEQFEKATETKVPASVKAKAGQTPEAAAPAAPAASALSDALGKLTNDRLNEILKGAEVEVDSKANKDALVAAVLASPDALALALTPAAPKEGE